MREIQTLPLSEVINKYAPYYPEGDDWNLTKEYLLSSPADKEVIDLLIEELSSMGSSVFREPIYLIDATADYLAYVGNGTHRIVTAMILGLEDIPITFDSYSEDKDALQYTSFLVPTQQASAENDDDTIFDILSDYLRSWKNKDGLWYEATLFSRSGLVYEVDWWFSPEVSQKVSTERVTLDVTERLNALNLSQMFTKIVTDTEYVM